MPDLQRRSYWKPTRRTPLSIVLDATAKYVVDKWFYLKSANAVNASQIDISELAVALNYLSDLEAGVYRIEHSRPGFVCQHNSKIFKFENEQINFRTPGPWDEMARFMPALFWGVIATVTFRYLILFWKEFVIFVVEHTKQFVQATLQIALICSSWFLVSRLVGRLVEREALVPSLAVGEGVYMNIFNDRTANEIGSDRQYISAIISSDKGGMSATQGVEVQSDPDLQAMEKPDVPIPPGITEIVMQSDDTGIDTIRKSLRNVRTLHLWFAWTSFAAFIAGTSIVLILFSMGYLDIFKGGAGGLAASSILALFSFSKLAEARKAQYALALFESYIAELQTTLREVAAIRKDTERTKRRSEAWASFRRGLNDLWREEQKTSSLVKKVRSASPFS